VRELRQLLLFRCSHIQRSWVIDGQSLLQ
jgi:hypothetical protein